MKVKEFVKMLLNEDKIYLWEVKYNPSNFNSKSFYDFKEEKIESHEELVKKFGEANILDFDIDFETKTILFYVNVTYED